eukprot:11182375-Lingulodinium_polyedra.AAC.1
MPGAGHAHQEREGRVPPGDLTHALMMALQLTVQGAKPARGARARSPRAERHKAAFLQELMAALQLMLLGCKLAQAMCAKSPRAMCH